MKSASNKVHAGRRKTDTLAQPPFTLCSSGEPTFDEAFAGVVKLLEGRKNVLVLAGAGMSVSCGIPDFRSEGSGLYSKLDVEVSLLLVARCCV